MKTGFLHITEMKSAPLRGLIRKVFLFDAGITGRKMNHVNHMLYFNHILLQFFEPVRNLIIFISQVILKEKTRRYSSI